MERPAPSSSPAGPAERLPVDRSSPWWGIHAARYLFSARYVIGRRVLDIACGTGYGLGILLQAGARWVAGVDLEEGAVREAHGGLGARAGAALRADGCLLPFADGCFDVVTSLETLEHLEARVRFLSELRRVLQPGGTCVLSTPNANYTRPINGAPRNPFHVHEYTPEELTAELAGHFSKVELLGQILDPRFVISPFWEDQQRLPHTLRIQARLLTWRVVNKLPAALREPVSEQVWGLPFLPTQSDYRFQSAAVQTAPVLVAVCSGGPAS